MMPAVEVSFTEPVPDRLFLDTDIIIAYLFRTQPHHLRSVAFIDRLVQLGATTLYLSTLTWVEFLHVIVQERFRRNLPAQLEARLRPERWTDLRIRQRYVASLLSAFEELLGQFTWVELDVTPTIRLDTAQRVARYNLDGQDAVHLASARYAGVRDFASFDARFRQVDDLVLWNDRIHTTS